MTRFVKTYNVYEGDSGVLELTDTKGNIEIYQPDCDLDKTQRLLYSFYEIKTSTGNIVKNSYVINERDWFPTSIGQLYWNYFYQIVKYRDLIDKYKLGKIKFTSLGGGNFEKVIDCIDCSHNNSLRVWLKKLYHRIIIIRNVILVKKKSDVIFFSYLIDDFRTKEIIESISEKYSVLHVAWVEKKKILRNIFNSNVYFYTSFNSCNMFNIAAIGCDDYVYNSALDYVNKTVSNHVQLYKDNIIIFNRLSAKVFAGIDDVSYVYPLLYAAKDCGIKSVGIQHGAYAKRHEAWIMKDINKHDWYDNVIVWGKYWKTIILNNSKLYSDNFHIVASNKHAYDYTHCTKKMTDNRSILIPYEFLADTIEIGNYIRMFIDHGVTVYFKARPDSLLLPWIIRI